MQIVCTELHQRYYGKMFEPYAPREPPVLLTGKFALVDLRLIEEWTVGLGGRLCSPSALLVCRFD